MQTLDRVLRNKLENTITRAREVAEEAAKSALEQLGVEQSSPYGYLSDEERKLRIKLRAHGRHLGDVQDSNKGTQEITRLVEEVAYEHWHRMLFAKFLAENQLLMFYEGNDIENAVAVTLGECEEMSPEMGCSSGWELASKLATKMLPQIFRPESPVFEIQLSPENQNELETLLSSLESEIFNASDSLGWVYQFWQTKKKKEVNDSEVKIGARELPTVTQLFTEPYMVDFLLDNSLGAWWAKRRLTDDDLKSASSEEELRNKASIPGVPLEYLRFAKDESGYWTPAGGNVDGWPEELSELKALDPCCGSGHFLVSAFLMLVPLRMELEGITANEACDKVLVENIHGLEIDQRCVELAAFNIALTAWKYPRAGGVRRLPELQIAWCGQSINIKREEWLALAENDMTVSMQLEWLYNLFTDASSLGSLINPRKYFDCESIPQNDWNRVKVVLRRKLEKNNYNDTLEIAALAQNLGKAFELLDRRYHFIITNVPYLTLKRQNDKLKNYITNLFPITKYELATVFIERSLELLINDGGILGAVTPINWTYLNSYKRFRNWIIKEYKILNISILGENAFESISGEVVKVLLLLLDKSVPIESSTFSGIDCTDTENKSRTLKQGLIRIISQYEQFNNPDQRILLGNIVRNKLLNEYTYSKRGIVNGDIEKWTKYFWENTIGERWKLIQSAVTKTGFYLGREKVIDWSTDGEGMLRPGLDNPTYSNMGIAVSRMGDIKATIYTGELYDQNAGVIIPYDSKAITAIWCYCESKDYNNAIRSIDKKLNVTSATLIQVPFDIDYWGKVAEGKYPNGLPKPYSNNPTQWIFHGNPVCSESPLHVAVARLLGYRWPAELDSEMELSDEARELVKKCDELFPYADKDGIVCIPSVRGEAPAAVRMQNLLAKAYKGQDVNAKLSELLAASDHAGKSLESWLRDKFFTQHCKLFGNRPFIWHIWDGLPDGFAVLVNYHKLDRKNFEALIYTYLGDWISKQKAELASAIDGADEKLAAAENLKKNLELILQGEAPFDIFVRWKPIEQQPIGWEPDINDGVRLNIRPFMSVPNVGKKGAGILRDKPNIKWDKDRGKDTSSSPWFRIFNGDRINNYHLTIDEKKKARDERG